MSKKLEATYGDISCNESFVTNNQFTPTDAEKQKIVDDLAESLGINQRRLQWKIDVMVVPAFILIYFLSFLDRINISNAKVYGMDRDLKLEGNQFNIALTVFFVPYIIFEVFANYLGKLLKPHIVLSVAIFMFGVITLAMGFVNNFSGLVACRFFLGLMESTTFGMIFYVLSAYYTQAESQRRFSLFFGSTCLSGAAGGSIAYKIASIKHHLASWRYIFIIEGAFTAGLALLLFFIIPDFPETSRFLSANEIKFLKKKLATFSSIESGYETKVTTKDYLKLLKDPIFWLAMFGYLGLIVPSYGYAYFAPTIITGLGYTAVEAQQHSVYPWLAAFGLILIVGFASDHFRLRWIFGVACAVIAIIGLLMIHLAPSFNAKYAGCFLTVSGLYASMPIFICWTSLNFGSHLRKSFGTAFQIGFANTGGIIATFLFLQKNAPKYTVGLWTSIGFAIFAIVIQIIYLLVIKRRNNIKQSQAYREQFDALSEQEQSNAGDLNYRFKYMY